MLIFIVAFFFGSGGWRDFQRNRRERKEMFALDARLTAEALARRPSQGSGE
jgi:hypothetical protein